MPPNNFNSATALEGKSVFLGSLPKKHNTVQNYDAVMMMVVAVVAAVVALVLVVML